MRSKKGSRRIVVGDAEYRWRAGGDDGVISIGIWPANDIGPYIQGNLRYRETWIDISGGIWSSARDQIVITNRIVRRIIEHATSDYGYDPQMPGKGVNLGVLDDAVKWDDAVRAS